METNFCSKIFQSFLKTVAFLVYLKCKNWEPKYQDLFYFFLIQSCEKIMRTAKPCLRFYRLPKWLSGKRIRLPMQETRI